MGDAIVRILALHPDVEITSRSDAPFGVLAASGSRACALDRNEQAALWHACGASPRTGDLAPSPPEVVERLAQRLLGEGLFDVTERPQSAIARDQHLALAEGVELTPAFYEVVDAREQTLHLISELGVMLFEACDGKRTITELSAVVQDKGFSIEASDVVKQVTQLQQANLVTKGFTPRRDGSMKIRVKAVIARAPGELGFLVSADEAEILQRFRATRAVQDLIAVQSSQQDRQWLMALLGKAATFGILLPSVADIAEGFENEFEQDNPTEITYAPTDDFADVAVPSRPQPSAMPASRATPPRMTPAPVRPTPVRPTPVPVHAPAGHVRQATVLGMPATVAPAAPVAPVTPVRRSAPIAAQMAPLSDPMPSAPAFPTPVGPAPVRPSSTFTAQGTPVRAAPAARPSSQFEPMIPTPVGPAPAPMDPRLASLQGLSLNKDSGDPTGTRTVPRSGGSSKLPWILLVLVVAGGGYYHFSTKGTNGAAKPAAGSGSDGSAGASTTRPAPPPGSVVLTASAYVAAKAPITLSSTTAGRVASMSVDAGDQVKKDQVVAKLDDRSVKARLRAAQAKAGAAARKLAGVKRLYRAQAKTMLDVSVAEGEATSASADVGLIKAELEDTKIKSPIDGTVLERLVQPGESLGATAGVMKIADLSKLVAEANINEGELKLVQMGQEAEIVVESSPGDPYKGIVREIAQQADRARGTVLVKIDVETDANRPLKPGMAVQVRFKAVAAPAPAPEAGSASAGSASSGSAAATPEAGSAK